MKISQLHINGYRHLKDLNLDFIYPEDFHDESKRGKPLDKICIIGQSATGKTGILELIKDFFLVYSSSRIVFEDKLINMGDINHNRLFKFIKKFEINDNEEKIVFKDNSINLNNKIYNYFDDSYSGGSRIFRLNENQVIYIKQSIVSEDNVKLFSKNPIELNEIKNNNEHFLDSVKIFDDKFPSSLYVKLINEFINFKIQYFKVSSEIVQKGLLGNTNKLEEYFKNWEKAFKNPFIELVKKFEKIYNLLELEFDIYNAEHIFGFKNKSNQKTFPFHLSSTGTKQILFSSLPLYTLETKDAIILIDEPERSLYPDIQMEIMEHYQNLAPDSQFIVATHSPFIAASFEPEERFILYFDEEGQVAVRRGTSPIGDDPNDILYNDLSIDYINKYGKKAYKEYLEIKRKLMFEEDPKEKEKLIFEIESIGDKYNF